MNEPDFDVISRVLVERRLDMGLTQAQVGERMGGISQSAVSQLERGEDPYLSTIMRYARAVGVRVVLAVEDSMDTKWEGIARFLRGHIEAGPDRRLLSEGELQTLFGVSRGTVRRALWELSKEGLIESRQGRGWFPR